MRLVVLSPQRRRLTRQGALDGWAGLRGWTGPSDPAEQGDHKRQGCTCVEGGGGAELLEVGGVGVLDVAEGGGGLDGMIAVVTPEAVLLPKALQ